MIPGGLSFDELNKLYAAEHDGNFRSMPFREYFGEMDISETQIRKRIDTAEKIYAFVLPAIMTMYYMLQDGYLDYDRAATEIVGPYRSLLEKLSIPLTAFFASQHVEGTVADIVSAMMNHTDDPYFFSSDRARMIAEDEANSIWNNSEYQDAILTGKTRKRWDTKRDKKVRDTHSEVEGVVIPIDVPFVVGDSLMMYPKDESMGASKKEISGCRCSATYF